MRPIRLAVVGAGHLGRIHARLASSLPGARLVAVVDPDSTNRRSVAADSHCEAFDHHRHLAGRVDAAVVATPTRFHCRVATDLLEEGIHLLVEKPLTTTSLEAEQLVDGARRRGLVLQVGHVERFNPALIAARAHLDAPKYIDAVRASGFSFRSIDIGVVLDLMIHDIDVVLSLVRSEVRSVEALGISLFGDHEDMADARLVFENGCVATLRASRASYTAERRMRVFSRRGLADIDFAAGTVEIVRPSETVLRHDLDVAKLDPQQSAQLKDCLLQEHLPKQVLKPPSGNPIQQELTEFVTSVRDGIPPRVSGEHGRQAVLVAERILAKIADHAWDGTRDGPRGPLAVSSSSVLRGPHWHRKSVGYAPPAA